MAAYRYRPGARYRYPYRLRRRGGNAEKLTGLGVGLFVAVAVAGHSAANHHHAATRAPAAKTVSVSAAPVASGSQTAFWKALLDDLGAPDDQANLDGLDAWRPLEQPWPPLARWNPLDSILPMPGSRAFNTFDGNLHVQSYPTAAEGAEADALTLQNGSYPNIVAALKAGTGLCGNPNLAAEFLTWSGGGYSGVC
jgi:hypothetical protein